MMNSRDIPKQNQSKKFLEQTCQFENDLKLIWEDFQNNGDSEKMEFKTQRINQKISRKF